MGEPLSQKMCREAAARALASCMTPIATEDDVQDACLKQRIHGFGNYQPPAITGDDCQLGSRGVVGGVAGLVGDVISDTVYELREKGAVGTVRDGVGAIFSLVVAGQGNSNGVSGQS